MPNPPLIDISIIIPTHNRKEILKRVLGKLFNQIYPKDRYEIVIVDDRCSDDTEAMVASLNFPCPHQYLKLSPDKNGPACGNNLGVRSARGRIVLFMNDDVFVIPTFIAEHMRLHKPYPNIIVQGPSINTTNFENPLQGTYDYSGYSNFQMGYFITWNCSIPKALIEKAGYFDEDFKPYSWEDIELGFRLRKLKIKQKFNQEAKAYHYRKPFSLEQLPFIKEKSAIMGINGVRYYKKHFCLETRIAVGAWWGMFLFQKIRKFIVKKLIGTKRIIAIYQWLYRHKWNKTLSMVIGWAGKYWYMESVYETLLNAPR